MVSDAIRIEGLSKRYSIVHQQGASALPRTFGESLAGLARRIARAGNGASRRASYANEDFWALRDVNLDIAKGRRLGVIGRNGAGKSTLLKILSRITEPTEGQATIRGRVASLLEVGTGFHPELTGRENVFLNGAILGMSQAEIRRRFDEIVDFAEIEQFLDTPVKRYSSGMYVRLAFAVAAHLESEILIVDEVLSVGDVEFQKKCLGRMDKIADAGRTIIFVSHATATVSRLCTHAVLLEKGRVVRDGQTHEVIRDYLLRNVKSSTIYELPPDPGKAMSLLRVELNPDKMPRTARLLYCDPIVIRVVYQVNEPVSNCSVWAALQTLSGTMVLCSCDYDDDADMLGQRAPGIYQADMTVPASWLNYGEYVVIVGLVRNRPVEVFNREETVSFEIEEIGMPSAAVTTGVRAGVLQPVLPWSLGKLE